MEYKVNNDFEEELDTETSVTPVDEEVTEEELANKKNRQTGKQVLEVRRAIEDYLERSRMRKELDYLFDEEPKV